MNHERLVPATIAVQQNTGLVLENFDDLQRVAKLFVASGMFSERSGEADMAKACVKIIAGQELGLKPFAAMRGIDIIKGVPSFRYQLIGAKIRQSGRYDYKILENTDSVARIQFFDSGSAAYVSTFTMEDAVRHGLAGNDTYKKMPSDMLFARAMSKGANKVCPELFYGACSSPEDFGRSSGDVVSTPGNEPVEAEVVEDDPKPAASTDSAAPAGSSASASATGVKQSSDVASTAAPAASSQSAFVATEPPKQRSRSRSAGGSAVNTQATLTASASATSTADPKSTGVSSATPAPEPTTATNNTQAGTAVTVQAVTVPVVEDAF